MDSYVPERVVWWAAQECAWQNSGEESVAWMIDGWAWASRGRDRNIRLSDVLTLGALVEPRHNRNGLRRVDVRVGSDVKLPHNQVPAALDALLDAQYRLGSEAWFREYEEIHPFRDGNGRTGSILFNWLRGSLVSPIHPPNLWHDPRRFVDGYPNPMSIAGRLG